MKIRLTSTVTGKSFICCEMTVARFILLFGPLLFYAIEVLNEKCECQI